MLDSHGQTLIKCKRCGKDKYPDAFYRSKLTKSGYRGACKECTQKQYKDYREKHKETLNKNKEEARVFREYKVSYDTYKERMNTSSKCEVCGNTQGNDANSIFCYDHDHTTGEFRGVLCRKCNQAIGALGYTLEGVEKALNYLRRHYE